MGLRHASGSPPNEGSPYGAALLDSRPRRALAAFMLGAAMSAAGLAALAADRAAAHGPFTALNPVSPFGGAQAGRLPGQVSYVIVKLDARGSARAESGDGAATKRRRDRITLIGGHLNEAVQRRSQFRGEAVCVRLCDGFFFPLPVAAHDAGSQAASCNSLCPDAPTEVYYRNRSDRIEEAVSAKGELYTALPVSLRYRGTSDNTCACHRDGVAYAPLRDETLKRGDAVMTPAGFMVFQGVEGVAHAARDFAALAKASLPASQRGALQALERVSLSAEHPSLGEWLTSQTTGKPAVGAVARASTGADKIRLLSWRGAED